MILAMNASMEKTQLDFIGVNHPAIVREIPQIWFFPAFFPKHPAFLCFFGEKKKSIFEPRRHFANTVRSANGGAI